MGQMNEKGVWAWGLMLCKDFVEQLGGKLWFDSEEGKGTTFYFSLKVSNQEYKRNSFGKASNGSTAIYAGIAGISGHKASAQQIQECGGILSVLLQEKKEESFKDKNA